MSFMVKIKKKNDILWIRLVSFIYEGNTVFVNVQAIQVS